MSDAHDYLESSKLYFSIAHDEYKSELARSKAFEEKTGRLLVVLNLLIVVILAVFFSSSFESLITQLSGSLKILVIFYSFILLTLIFISWWFLIEASHFTYVKRISVDDNLRRWLSFKTAPEMYIAAGDQCRASIEETTKNIENCKVKPLNNSLFFLKLSVVTLLGYLILILILKFGAIPVSDNISNSSQSQQKPLREIPEYKPEPLRNLQENNVKPVNRENLFTETKDRK